MAREYGIEGFCYWHYWFGHGRQLLQRPFNEVLQSGEPDFPFCLAWANHSWEDKQFNRDGGHKMLMEQLYPGDEDYIAHFNAVLPAFKDPRYIRVHGNPVFVVYAPTKLRMPHISSGCGNNWPEPHGFRIHFVGHIRPRGRHPALSPMGIRMPRLPYAYTTCSRKTSRFGNA